MIGGGGGRGGWLAEPQEMLGFRRQTAAQRPAGRIDSSDRLGGVT
jgi:hypothetical protein